MLGAVVWLGFLLGLRHACEADHLAAVGALASGAGRPGELLRVAGAWGLGHAVVLLIAGTVMVAAGATLSPHLSGALEALAGVALVWLGGDVLRRLLRPRRSARPHVAPSLSRALLVGGLHGFEGSGSVVLIALPALRSPAQACAYLALFGAGSVAGMLACSVALAMPLEAARRLAWGAWALQLVVAVSSIAVGGAMALRGIQ